ncbi:Putative polyphosphate synthetase [Nosema bombycis CQ1]|uniref:Putative polyphosphate synthetase n=1 Tax=Nosema bombycis (strain CQ1 / CVCC 102059) TaxID=578461 RepID=R0MLP0_NOSB1|nr:Putative polyphosphate synthetase [Nosema bombycis CQ1]|eukprot:EOB15165.1 Putative polyphosphate synthetase [Nosema bombycis CQ1]
MRFQKYLKVNRYKPYKYYYLDYEILRNSITSLKTQKEEDSFKSLLDENLNRVFGFIESKYQEIKGELRIRKRGGRKARVILVRPLVRAPLILSLPLIYPPPIPPPLPIISIPS